MTRLLILAILSAEPNATVTPCGNAACVSTYQTPVTLGGTVQVNQTSWPDGGVARLTPVVPGATLTLTGVQAHNSTTPDVTINSINTRDSSTTLLSVKNRQVEVFAIKGDGSATAPGVWSPGVIDAGTAYIRGQLEVGGTTALLGTLNAADVDAGSIYDRGGLQVAGPVVFRSSDSVTSCPLDGGSPSQCDATVRSGSACGCFPVGTTAPIAAGGCAVHLSGTTLTATSANTLTNNVNIFCF